MSSPSLYHSTMATSGFSPLTISGISLWWRGIGTGIVLIGPVRDFSFWPHWGLTWGPLDL